MWRWPWLVLLAAAVAASRGRYELKHIVPVNLFTQAALEASWRYDADMMCFPTGLRGFVKKTGSGHSLWSILNITTDASQSDVTTMAIPIYASIQATDLKLAAGQRRRSLARLVLPTQSRTAEQPVVRRCVSWRNAKTTACAFGQSAARGACGLRGRSGSSCSDNPRVQMYVSHKYKFIYLRQPKASSTSIVQTLFQMLCADSGSACRSGEVQRLFGHASNRRIWAEYFVFTVVRNPIGRMLSTYIMFNNLLRYRDSPSSQVPGEYCNVPFSEYAKSVFRLRSACDTDRCCAYLEKHHFLEKFVNSHITQQVHAVFTPEGEVIVDYVGASENIDEDWTTIVAEIKRCSGLDFELVPLKHENTGAAFEESLTRLSAPLQTDSEPVVTPSCLSQGVAKLGLINETTAFNIARQFAMDMVFLRFIR